MLVVKKLLLMVFMLLLVNCIIRLFLGKLVLSELFVLYMLFVLGLDVIVNEKLFWLKWKLVGMVLVLKVLVYVLVVIFCVRKVDLVVNIVVVLVEVVRMMSVVDERRWFRNFMGIFFCGKCEVCENNCEFLWIVFCYDGSSLIFFELWGGKFIMGYFDGCFFEYVGGLVEWSCGVV